MLFANWDCQWHLVYLLVYLLLAPNYDLKCRSALITKYFLCHHFQLINYELCAKFFFFFFDVGRYQFLWYWHRLSQYISVQFSPVTQSCPTLCDPMNRSTPGLPVHHQLPEFTQTHVHQVSDAIQPSHPLSSPSPPAPNPSQHQSLLQWVNSSHEVAKVLEFQL